MDLLVLIKTLEKFYLVWGYPFIFASTFIETTPLGWTIPGGTILALGGFFAYGGKISLIGVVISGWLGMFATFILTYFLGKKSGYFLIKYFKQEKNALVAKHLLENHGPVILTTSLLANLTRFWISYLAGVEKYSFIKFLFYSGAASLTWSTLLVTIGYLAGTERSNLEKGLTGLGIFSWVFLLVLFGILFLLIKRGLKEYKDENRQ